MEIYNIQYGYPDKTNITITKADDFGYTFELSQYGTHYHKFNTYAIDLDHPRIKKPVINVDMINELKLLVKKHQLKEFLYGGI